MVLAIIVGLMVSVGFGLAGYTVYWLVKFTLAGRSDDRLDNIPERLGHMAKYAFGQARVIREPIGIVHFFIFWGFLVLQIETVEYIIRAFFPDFHWATFIGYPAQNGLMFLQDMFGLVVLVACLIAFIRRFFFKPPQGVHSFDAYLILWLIIALMFTKFLANGADIAMATTAHDIGWDYHFTPLAGFTADLVYGGHFRGAAAAGFSDVLFHISYLIHIAIVIFFANWVPRGKHFHVFLAIPNVFFRKLQPAGALQPIDLEDEEAESFGAGKMEDLTWKQLFDTYSCTECGRCQMYCPAFNTGKELNPMMLIHGLQDHLREKGAKCIKGGAEDDYPALAGGIVSAEVLWSCTTCGACVGNCPVLIEHVDTIVDMRRYLALTEASFPAEVGRVFKNIENNGNPWGISRTKRAEWTEGLDFEIPLWKDCDEKPEYLFWVGCAGSFDDRQKKVSIAFAKLLKEAGVSFAILGAEEGCSGDPARRIGNEYLYWMCATENIETLNNYGVKKIVTTCPHCFHTLGKEYPQHDGNYEVVHHTHLLASLIEEGRLKLTSRGQRKKITYHDSCYIGRWTAEYDSPREVLKATGSVDLVEMDLNKRKSFCCGAGGGRMWMEEMVGKRVNVERTDQALATEPDEIALACPFCMTMFMDGLGLRGAEDVKTRDIAEILVDYI